MQAYIYAISRVLRGRPRSVGGASNVKSIWFATNVYESVADLESYMQVPLIKDNCHISINVDVERLNFFINSFY